MAPKPPGRAAAKDIPDRDMLEAVDQYTRVGAPFPTDPFVHDHPKNVIAAKLVKLERRGLIDTKRHLTRTGRETLDSMREKADG